MRCLVVGIAMFQVAVLAQLPEKDRAIGSEIFDLKNEQAVSPAYLLFSGFGIGFVLSLVLIHLYYGSRALEESPFLLTIALTAACIAGAVWLLHKFYYGPKLQKLNAELQEKLKDPDFKRVSKKIVFIGKKIQPGFHL